MEETRKKDDEKTEKNRKRREKRNVAKKKKDGKGGSARGGDRMAVDADPGVHNAANDGDVPQAEETPGVIIHDD